MIAENELRWYGRSLSKKLKQLRIIPFSDLHYGNPYCSLKHAERTLNIVSANEDTFMVLNGDLLEAVTKLSKGDIYAQKITPQEQRDEVIKLLKPLSSKILGMTTGNHEMRIYRETGVDLSLDIARELNVPYRSEGILLKITFGDGNNRTRGKPFTYWVYATHGYGGARTKSAKAVKVERVSTWIHADCYIMAHDHVVNVAPDIYLLPDNRGKIDSETGFTTGRLRAVRKMLVKSNAYLKWGGYSEQGGFPPSDLSTPVIILAGEGQPKVSVIV